MATQRQKKLARAIAENLKSEEPKNAKELLVSSGYSVSSAEASSKDIMEQKGVLEELVKNGFNETNAKAVVTSIMLDDEEDGNTRLKAADMTFKIHGSYAPEKSVSLQLRADSKDFEKYKELNDKYDQDLLSMYQNG